MGEQEFLKFQLWSVPTDKAPGTLPPIIFLQRKEAEVVKYMLFLPKATALQVSGWRRQVVPKGLLRASHQDMTPW